MTFIGSVSRTVADQQQTAEEIATAERDAALAEACATKRAADLDEAHTAQQAKTDAEVTD